jgi:hypothetical protein
MDIPGRLSWATLCAKDPTNLAWREKAIDLTFPASMQTRRWQEATMEHEQHGNRFNTVTK